MQVFEMGRVTSFTELPRRGLLGNRASDVKGFSETQRVAWSFSLRTTKTGQ